MDVDLARTFLAIVECGSFADAAKKIHVTQSTVSARVKSLEDLLGRPVFQRGKSGAALTEAGRRFHRHASTFLRTWQAARMDVALPDDVEETISIGGAPSLWDGFLLNVVAELRRRAPGVALRAELGFSEALVEEVAKGALDLAVLYAPQLRPGYKVERLFDDTFVLATSEQTDCAEGELPPGYVFVDWGPEFRAEHAAHFPELAPAALQLRLGAIGLNYLSATPASAYFPRRSVMAQKTPPLRLIENAPVFSCPAFALFPEGELSPGLETALQCLRETAGALRDRAAPA